ncbi:MAG TPA: P-II family nitrogen regulator [Clostridiaceae bacterium]|nr:P-II family nitrogen regulator [Clostridiaceae bacterium]
MDKQNDETQSIWDIRMLTLILSEHQSHKCVSLVKKMGLKGGMIIIGRGTVSNTVLNLLGIKNQRRDIIKILLKKEKAKEIMDCLDESLQLSKPGHGIAYITPVISAVGLPWHEKSHEQIDTNAIQGMEEKSMFKKLTVIVDRGMADDVMDIARKAGVRGGTILHGRGANTELATNLFGVKIEPEKELVIILMPNDLVDKVVQALSQELHLDEPGKGILFVEPVLDTRGLFEMREKHDKKHDK